MPLWLDAAIVERDLTARVENDRGVIETVSFSLQDTRGQVGGTLPGELSHPFGCPG